MNADLFNPLVQELNAHSELQKTGMTNGVSITADIII